MKTLVRYPGYLRKASYIKDKKDNMEEKKYESETEKEKKYNHEIRIKSCFKNDWKKMNDSWEIENMIAEISKYRRIRG